MANSSQFELRAAENPTAIAEVRDANAAEVEHLAWLWREGWQDAHGAILPAELARHRTLESFRQRLGDEIARTRVAGPLGRPDGLCIVKQDELYQLYVANEARGKGVGAALLADGERRIAAAGAMTAWLACAIGNNRAARFYEKSGWTRIGPMINEFSTPGGIFRLEVWRYEKRVQFDPARERQ